METLRKLADAGHDTITPETLKETADSVIQNQDIESIFEKAKQNCDAER